MVFDPPKYKLQVDYRTTITLKTKEAVDAWIKKYPNAKLIK
jgi:hypothetical protein